MIITKAPLRISFGGGGTDISPFCDEYGGACLAVAIDKYAYATYKRAPANMSNEEKAVCDYFGLPDGSLGIAFYSIARSGLGGSAAGFVAGTYAAIKGLGNALDSPRHISYFAYTIERKTLGILGGFQDQVVSAYGGLLLMEFPAGGKVKVERLLIPVKVSMKLSCELENLLYLIYTGDRINYGGDVIEDQLKRYNKQALLRSKELVYLMKEALDENNLEAFGNYIEEAWQVKKEFTPLISTPRIDTLHDFCLSHGAIAFKLCGAGSGGYAMVMADPRKSDQLPDYLKRHNINFELVTFDIQGVREINMDMRY